MYCLFDVMLRIGPKALYILGKYSTDSVTSPAPES